MGSYATLLFEKSANEVKFGLLHLFQLFLPAESIQSDCGREFLNNTVKALVSDIKSVDQTCNIEVIENPYDEGPEHFRKLFCDNEEEEEREDQRRRNGQGPVRQDHSRPRNPQAQGAVERANQTLKAKLQRAMIQHKKRSWDELLFYVVSAMNTQRRESLDWKSPYEIIFGRKPTRRLGREDVEIECPDDEPPQNENSPTQDSQTQESQTQESQTQDSQTQDSQSQDPKTEDEVISRNYDLNL